MTVIRYAPNSGADGDALTTSNANQSDIWSYASVNGGVGTAAVESTSVHSIPSVTRIFRFAKTTSSGQNYGLFSETPADTYAFRLWFWFTALSSGTTQMVRFLTAANAAALNLCIMSTGKIKIQSPSAADLWYPNAGQTIDCTTGVLYRLEGYVNNDDTAGTLKARLIRDSDGATMASTTTLTGLDMAAADVGNVRIGAAVSTNSLSIDWEGILDWEPGATDYLPTWNPAGPPTGAIVKDGDWQFLSTSSIAPVGTDTGVVVTSITPSTGCKISVDENGVPGVFVPNTTQSYTVRVTGDPSGSPNYTDFTFNVVENVGSTVNTTAPHVRAAGVWS